VLLNLGEVQANLALEPTARVRRGRAAVRRDCWADGTDHIDAKETSDG
jgi:hypothetical protein